MLPNVGMRRAWCVSLIGRVSLLILLSVVVGCQMDQWDWGRGQWKQSPNRRAGTRARRPVRPVASSDRGPATGAASTENARAQDVERRVADHYDAERSPSYDSTVYGDSLTARIDRNADPNRQARIRSNADAAYRDTAAIPVRDDGGAAPAGPSFPKAVAPPESNSPGDDPSGEILTPIGSGAVGREARGSNAKTELTDPASTGAGPVTPDTEPATTDPNPVRPADDSKVEGGVFTNEGIGRSWTDTNKSTPSDNPAAGRANAPASIGEGAPAPPSLGNVEVSVAPSPSESEEPAPRPVARTTPNVPAAQPVVNTLKQRIDELESAVFSSPNDVEKQLRLRMFYLAEGMDDKALEQTPGMNEGMAEILDAHVRALLAARSSIGRDSATWAQAQLDAIETLHAAVRARADLQVPNVKLCTAINGYGLYDPIEPAEFVAGRKNQVLVYIEVDNYESQRTPAGMYRTQLAVRWSLLSRDGQELQSHVDKGIEDVARTRRRDFYLTVGPLTIPSGLPVGDYVLKVEVEDELAGKINSNTTTFRMRAP